MAPICSLSPKKLRLVTLSAVGRGRDAFVANCGHFSLTDFNVAISIIALFFLLAKLILFIMRGWYPIVAVSVNLVLTTLYAVSVFGQVGPDYADSRYPSPAAWYFRYGCDLARPHGMYRPCQIAQGSLGVTLYML